MPRSAPSASRPCASGLPRRRHLIAEGSGRLPWRGSLRLRITLLTALVVALVVALGGSLILLSLESELIGAADAAAKDRAQQTPRQAAAGTLPASPPAMEDPETPSEVVSGGQLVTATAGQDRGHRPHAPIGGARFMVVLPIQPETPADRGKRRRWVRADRLTLEMATGCVDATRDQRPELTDRSSPNDPDVCAPTVLGGHLDTVPVTHITRRPPWPAQRCVHRRRGGEDAKPKVVARCVVLVSSEVGFRVGGGGSGRRRYRAPGGPHTDEVRHVRPDRWRP
jgi:hypothetical protein